MKRLSTRLGGEASQGR